MLLLMGLSVASAPTNSAKWGDSHLIYPRSTTVIASKDTNARLNTPFPSPVVFERLESGRMARLPPILGRFAKAKRQLVGVNDCPSWPLRAFLNPLALTRLLMFFSQNLQAPVDIVDKSLTGRFVALAGFMRCG